MKFPFIGCVHRRRGKCKQKIISTIKLAGEPVSRILSPARQAFLPTTPSGDHSSRSRIASGLKQPTRGSRRHTLSSVARTGRAGPPLLFGLAPRGVFRASDVAIRAVGSYPTFSPLPSPSELPLAIPQGKCARPKQAGFRFFRNPAAEVQAAPAVLFSVALSVAALSQRTFARCDAQPPGVTRRVALPWPSLARSPQPESGLSSRSFVRLAADSGQAGDHPAHPLSQLYATPSSCYSSFKELCVVRRGPRWESLFASIRLHNSGANAAFRCSLQGRDECRLE